LKVVVIKVGLLGEPTLILHAAKTVDVGDKLLFDYNDHQSSLEFLSLCPVFYIYSALQEYNTMIW